MTKRKDMKAKAFTCRGAAFVLLIALIILVAAFMLTGCPNAFGGGVSAERIVVKFDETHINVGLNGTFIPTGHTVYEGGRLSFRTKNLPAGQQVDKWKVNGKEIQHTWYTVNVADAVDDGTQKVITVTYTLKADG